MLPVGSYLASDRAREKQESRERDELRVESNEEFGSGFFSQNEEFRNGFFSQLDRSKVKIVRRRVAA
jgi:hypothetical protein